MHYYLKMDVQINVNDEIYYHFSHVLGKGSLKGFNA